MPPPKSKAEVKAEKAFTDSLLLDQRFRILYFVPHSDQNLERASIFCGFLEGLVDTAHLFSRLAFLPYDIRELFAPWKSILMLRVAGRIDQRIFPIQRSAFEEIVSWEVSPFKCVVSTKDNHEEISNAIAQAKIPWLHISTHKGAGSVHYENVGRSDIKKYVMATLGKLQTSEELGHKVISKVMASMTENDGAKKASAHHLKIRGHNITWPNESALLANGFRLKNGYQLKPRPSNEQFYIKAIIDSANCVTNAISNMLPTSRQLIPRNKYIITVPSLFRSYYLGSRKLNKEVDEGLYKAARFFLRQETRKSSYVPLHDAAEFLPLLESPPFLHLTKIRAGEMHAYTVALGLAAAARMTPVLRLEPKLNKLNGPLTMFGACARSKNPHKDFKLNRMFANLGRTFQENIDPLFLEKLKPTAPYIESMKIFSDLPLEWIPINGLPLMLRYDCSRISVTPGGLFFGQAIESTTRVLSLTDFQEILIIRSFTKGDRIAGMLQKALALFPGKGKFRIRVRWIDVATREEFIAAVNSFKGALLIFDGHGYKTSQFSVGTILINGQPLDIWELKKECRNFPPIVMFSACDTHPIDGNHGSSANGVCALGVSAVLATLLPINALEASVFLARFIYRLEEYLPTILSTAPHEIRWSEVVAGMIRMSYAWDMVRALPKFEPKISEEALKDIQLQANIAINQRLANWYELVIDRAAHHLGKSNKEIIKGLAPLCSFSDSLKYVQIGRPDNIIIVERHPMEIMAQTTPQDGSLIDFCREQ